MILFFWHFRPKRGRKKRKRVDFVSQNSFEIFHFFSEKKLTQKENSFFFFVCFKKSAKVPNTFQMNWKSVKKEKAKTKK